ncbi:helix-turn-helix domain-containing protein [Embleya sp. NPDC059237]|uniref:helix-turn-helix domain-containing protein n=1 Tax=Embleya sp. NPDC059237 TaxID=3346784 RepID=UPI0036BF6B12
MNFDPQQAGRDRLRLASALRALRSATGLSGERLAARCGMSQSKISRIETGRTLPTLVDVRHILTALGVDAATAEEIRRLAEIANTEYEDVRTSVRRGLHHRQRELAILEAGADHIRHFLPTMITGLLQTPEYMRRALSPTVDPTAGDTTKTMVMKLERQSVLHDGEKRFDFLLTESATRWQLCHPSAMALQLDHLVAISRLPRIRLHILPLRQQMNDAPFNTFVIYDSHLVTVELFSGRLILRDPKDIAYHRELFDYFAARSLSGDDARRQIESWSEAFRRQSMQKRD